MNLKRKLLMILLQTVLILTLSAQTLKTNKKNLENELGIDLTRTYDGDEVAEIISIILDEADNSIEIAYKEGYKQATVELQPEVTYWKTLYEESKTNDVKKNLQWMLISLGSGFIIGGTTGFTLGLNIPVN